jgi:predicted nucleotidyltransferase
MFYKIEQCEMMLEKLFRSRAGIKVLGVVLFEEGLHLREIARRSNTPPSVAKKELDNLVSIGILTAEEKGKQKFFYINHSCPLVNDLKNLYLKTKGFAEELKRVLKDIEGIKYAFVFGSAAGEKETKKSDIDLMIIGEIDEEKLTTEIFRIQKKFSREINFIIWSWLDFKRKLANKSSFLRNIYKKKRIWLHGDESEFNRTLKKAFD